MNATGLPRKDPTELRPKVASRSVNWRRSEPSALIDQRLRRPSRSLSNTMRVPSGVKPLRVSSDGFEVSRTASPPAAGARQRSPRHENTSSEPSGESDGKRGRSTTDAPADPAARRGAASRTRRARPPLRRGLAEVMSRWIRRRRFGVGGGSACPRALGSAGSPGAGSLRPLHEAVRPACAGCAGASEESPHLPASHGLYAPMPFKGREPEASDRVPT